MRREMIASLIWAALVWTAALPVAASPQQPEPLSAFPQSLLAVRTAAGSVINFKIWTADTPGRKEQGLMYVREMDEHAGMWFLFPSPERQAMWMKNTFLSLDLVFVNSAGRIDHIAARAVPLSLAIIQSPRPVVGVLELNGGACERLGIHEGDLVLHSSLTAHH
jgi:uncharacterized membrane protein (UPF0127 family)